MSTPSRDSDLDPVDWTAFRGQAHAMLDDMLDHLSEVRQRPVWQAMPADARARFRSELPSGPSELADVHREFLDLILPFSVGNLHPRFFGWVHGAGTPVGMLAEMLAGGMNANLGGRDHAAIEVERQVARWMAELFGFPPGAAGLFVTGASMGNFVALLAARTRALGAASRSAGIDGAPLTAYASQASHNCIPRAMEMAGLGSDALRMVPTDAEGRIRIDAAAEAIIADRREGRRPFLLIGAAGTVDIGAIDDLAALAALADREGLWLHVDGALGALGMMSQALAPRFAGIERADSIAFDFHKWGQAPYDAGFVLVREQNDQLATFSSPAAYLGRAERGLAAGSPWPCDLGPDLSRGFRALKVWMTLKTHGAAALGASMLRTCRLAAQLADRIDGEPELERLAPVALNIVCFRFRAEASDRVNGDIVIGLQEAGLAAPSTTRIGGRLAIRAAIVNHRTREDDLDALVELGSHNRPPPRRRLTGRPRMLSIPAIDPGLSPIDAIDPAHFIRLAFEGVELAPIIADRVGRLGSEDDSAAGLLELGVLFQLVGERDKALMCQRAALDAARLYRHGLAAAPSLRVLALVTFGDLMANTPLELMLEGRGVEVTKLYVGEEWPLGETVPDHDLAIMAVSESDQSRPLLRQLQSLDGRWPRPVVNRAAQVLELARDRLYLRLDGAAGIAIPPTVRTSRDALLAAAQAGSFGSAAAVGEFPLIIRPVDSHAGKSLERVEDWAALEVYLDGTSDGLFYVSPFIDYRSADGLYRKYRIAFFSGRPFLCHMAVSDHWMVHYLNAGMAESPAKRAEEQAAMETFDDAFAQRHAAGFQALCERLGLDYFAIDCAELLDGSLLIFEADVAMIIHDLDPPGLYPYKKQQMRKVFDAFEDFLQRRAAG